MKTTRSSKSILALPDVELWDCLRQGDKEVFNFIYQQYNRPLYRYGSQFTYDRALLEDSIHDLFLEIWEKHDRLSPVDSIKFYLFRSIKNNLVRRLVKAKNFSPIYETEVYEHFSQECSHEHRLIENEHNQEKLRKLQESTALLPKSQREILYMKYFTRMSYDEIAEKKAINRQSVANSLFRSLQRLREQF
ncbi:RNA polymerase sigma factor, sigma-70 family [Pseudarcicella hirudinis]|uniref:RNA polymerase sigma factor, sigma-70 family n=1 Tax=Pseudarcicella hirudinis TaxID=1079859 RepID=A0A1I5YWP1_9BACT|nr:sigma-70 family RNA polymerase sigma factor [Pseudarcicella hirudinis]SFQ48644.1 RNA polymerase sigma factor, sigma-70 family [Pseudarcicella hirudinis]